MVQRGEYRIQMARSRVRMLTGITYCSHIVKSVYCHYYQFLFVCEQLESTENF